MTNHILILPDEDLSLIDGMVLSADFDPMRHVAVTGTVLRAGKKFFTTLFPWDRGPADSHSPFTYRCTEINELSLPWDPQDWVSEGDRVMFHYVNHLVAKEEGPELFVEGRQVLLVPYYQIYLRLPAEPLNGYVLIEPEERAIKDIAIPEKDASRGVVKMVGKPYSMLLSDEPMGIHPQVGQRVYYKSSAPTVEYLYHQTLNPGGRPLVRAQSHEILGIV